MFAEEVEVISRHGGHQVSSTDIDSFFHSQQLSPTSTHPLIDTLSSNQSLVPSIPSMSF